MEQQKRAIALGFFDGVHLGHQALLQRTMERAAENGLAPAVFTFDRSPREFVTGVPVPLLTTVETRRQVVDTLFPGMELMVAQFDWTMMHTPWEDFFRMLVEQYRAGWLVCGHDFRFGSKNLGTPELLTELCRREGMGCDVIPAVALEGVTVSSTVIRKFLEAGETEKAARFLGRPFAAACTVRQTELIPDGSQLLPAEGSYASRITAGKDAFSSVVTVKNGLLTGDGKLPEGTEHCQVEFLHRV